MRRKDNMDEQTVIQLLEQLHEFEVQRDGIEEEKRRLLDEVTIPEEVKQIHDEGMMAIQEMERVVTEDKNKILREIQDTFKLIDIPEEVKILIQQIEEKRQENINSQHECAEAFDKKILAERKRMMDEIDAKVKATYDAVAQRKLDIADEFAGKKGVAEQNIADLIKKIEDAVKELKTSVKGTHKMAVYTPGKTSWNTKALDDLIIQGHDELKPFRKVGDPYIQIRKI